MRMSGNNSTWADQWDDGSDPVYDYQQNTAKNKTSSTAKYKQKVGEGFDKTKSVASSGVKKVKEGTVSGFHWIKDKYHKTTQKH